MISVIIPVYNGEKFIMRCLQSLSAQTLKTFEAVIVDNNSKDNTAKIVQSYCESDKRFVYHFCVRAGVSNARNTGINVATGDYCFFLDADDEISPDALMLMNEASKRYACDIVVSNILYVQDEKSTPCDRQNPVNALMTDDGVKSFFCQKLPTYLIHPIYKLYNREFLNYHSIIFDPKLSLGEDLLFNIAAFSYAHSVYYISKPLIIHYMHDSGLAMKYRKDLVSTKVMLHETFSEHLKSKNLFDISYYELLMNDVFSMVVNERTYKKIKAVLYLDCVEELVNSKVLKRLNIKKKVIFLLIKYKFPLLLKLSAMLWKLGMSKNVIRH